MVELVSGDPWIGPGNGLTSPDNHKRTYKNWYNVYILD